MKNILKNSKNFYLYVNKFTDIIIIKKEVDIMKYNMLNWNSNVNAFVFLLLGLLLLIFPIESISIFGYLIASILMLMGISNSIKTYNNRNDLKNKDILYLIISIAAIGLSITIFIDPTWIIRMINILVGIILLITSFINLNNLLKYKDSRTTSWWIYISITGLIILLAILILIDPNWLAKIIIRLAGAALILDTLITILLTRKNNKLEKTDKKVIEGKIVNIK